MVIENKVLPHNQQEGKNEGSGISFVKLFKGMERFAILYDIMTVFEHM